MITAEEAETEESSEDEEAETEENTEEISEDNAIEETDTEASE